jgi:inner membrane protein
MESRGPVTALKGAFLQKSHGISNDGFTAEWSVVDLNHNFPQQWTTDRYRLNPSGFGVDLIVPVDDYQRTYRSIHYAI